MEPKEVLNILSDYKNSSNSDLTKVMDFLQKDFEKTKDLIIKLTKHLDVTEQSYNKVFEEYKKRMNNVG
jgi:energy-converting hydrogenase A subunit M